nr:helix-turn-helix transcriptional regulator [uncultured Oscillibacter sp.]
MESLPTRMKKLRESRRIYQREIAETLGVTTRAYQFYESGRSEPNIKTLIAIADYFQVSIDYLVGRTDVPGVNRGDAEE